MWQAAQLRDLSILLLYPAVLFVICQNWDVDRGAHNSSTSVIILTAANGNHLKA